MAEEQIEFGSKQWFDQLNKLCKFPGWFVFYIDTDRRVFSTYLKHTNAQTADRMQYKTIASYSDEMAIAGIKWLRTDQAYFEQCKHLKEVWSKGKVKG
ncbi:hypothetical protein [Sporolactobacillus terrae]|uniref:hypothetical protein n=1 Tax=Sporolactobacillus terrae TaxID=269673 RepID=UPI00048AC696|nr:hypothetical protein [Sporolactobacillus terrae]